MDYKQLDEIIENINILCHEDKTLEESFYNTCKDKIKTMSPLENYNMLLVLCVAIEAAKHFNKSIDFIIGRTDKSAFNYVNYDEIFGTNKDNQE